MARQQLSNQSTEAIEREIAHFLRTGNKETLDYAWGGDWMSAAKQADHDMRQALIAAVRTRASGLAAPKIPQFDQRAFTRAKVAPMVNGLFPQAERNKVIEMLEKSVIFLTAENIEDVLQQTSPLSTAWMIANLYLLSISAELMSDEAPRVVGLSEETVCYVSHAYFKSKDPFADFVVHEAAHVFHNCRRTTVGLPELRKQDHLLKIDYCERETFAYACEAYSRILERASTIKERSQMVADMDEDYLPSADIVDIEKYKLALTLAAAARNGWKKILEVCAPGPGSK